MKYNYDELNKFRKHMVDEGGNLSWCRPYKNGNVKFAMNEGDFVGLEVDGKNVDFDVEGIKKVSEMLKTVYPDIDYTDEESEDILFDRAEEMDCRNCPWFMECEAMDSDDDEDDEDED